MNINLVAFPNGLKAKHTSHRPSYNQKRIGRGGYQLEVTDIVKVDVWEFYRPIAGNVAT